MVKILDFRRNSTYFISLLAIAGMGTLWTGFNKFAPKGVDLPYTQIKPHTITLDLPEENDRSGGLIAVDINGDSQQDFLVSKPGYLVAYTYSGEQLWKKATNIQLTGKAESRGLPGLHAAGVQAGDVDGDGKTEVLFLTSDNTLEIVQGEDGVSEASIKLQSLEGSNGWEHLVVGNFRGGGDRDILLQGTNKKGYKMGRYLAAYSIETLLTQENPQPLWTTDNFLANAHNGVRIADLDGDGKDEVLGGTILSGDGKLLYKIPMDLQKRPHVDSLFVADVRPDIPGLELVALEEGGENRIFLYNERGLIWSTDYRNQEPQNAAIGDFDPQRPGLEIWSRSRYNERQKPFIFDAQGELIGKYEMENVAPKGWTEKGVETIFTIDWRGDAKQLAAAKERHESGDIGIFDPLTGEFLYKFSAQADRFYVADVTGDWREDLIVLEGNKLHIFTNEESNPQPEKARLWKQNHYRRSKMTWNYYSP